MSPSTLQIIAVNIFILAIIYIFLFKYFEYLAQINENEFITKGDLLKRLNFRKR